MSKTLLLCLCVLMVSFHASFSQTCGIFLYNTDGKKFKVYANGELQNTTAMSEVRLCCFPMDIVKVKLEFEDKSVIEKKLFLRIGFIEHHIVTDKKIVFDSYEEMPQEYADITNITVINVNTASGGKGGYSGGGGITTVTSSNRSCMSSISDKSFYEFSGHFKSRSFDSDKLEEGKSAVKRDCFTSKQIKILLGGFTYESSKLEFAKYAYSYVYDKGAYATVKEGFSNSLSGNELDDFINNRR